MKKFIAILLLVFSLFSFLAVVPAQVDTYYNKDHSKWRFFGQYVQYGQPQTNWSIVKDRLGPTEYNGFTAFLNTHWGNLSFYAWPKEGAVYNLNKLNWAYFNKFEQFATEVGGKGDNVLSLVFFDNYYANPRYLPSGNHPLIKNNRGFNWSGDGDKLLYNPYQGGNNFTWLWYQTTGKGYNERVTAYRFQGPFGIPARRYIVQILNTLQRVKLKYPNLKVYYRVYNEEHGWLNTDGTRNPDRSLGGDDRVRQVFEDLFRIYAPAFKKNRDMWVGNDWAVLVGGKVMDHGLTARDHRYTFSRGWLQELHNSSAPNVTEYLKQELCRTGCNTVPADRIVFSLDSLKPEDDTFIPRSKATWLLGLRRIDQKVPATGIFPYYAYNYNKTFLAILPYMMQIAGHEE